MPEENNQVDPDNINYTTNTYGSNSEETNVDSTNDDLEETNEPPIELKEEFVTPKKSILPKILLGIAALLILLLIIGAVLYFIGFFSHKEPVKVEHQEATPVVEKVETTDNNYKFDIKDINSKKLNEQLANLTSKNMANEENEKKLQQEQKQKEDELLKSQENELLKQKAQLEEKKLELEKEKAQLEEMKQQAVVLKNELESNTTNNINESIPAKTAANSKEPSKEVVSNTQENKNEFLLFISVAKIKGVLYKKYLDKIVAINSNVKLCRDDENRIEIYYGPFEKNEDRTDLLNKLISNKFNEAYELEFTQEEFDKRCNY